jgi:ATP-dependent Clp protease ATP-binding subunit ClpC
VLPEVALDVLDEASALEKLKQEDKYKGYKGINEKLVNIKEKKDNALKQQMFDKALDFKKLENDLKNDMKLTTRMKKESYTKGEFKVTSEDIKGIISEWTGIPVTTLSSGDMKSLKGIKKRISKRIIGQKDALEKVTSTLKRARLGISDETRPLASFLFLGPTGVGKTEMAKIIAKQSKMAIKAMILYI